MPAEPEVGMGASILVGTDRYAATVVEVLRHRNGKLRGVVVQEDRATPRGSVVYTEHQEYDYARDPDAARKVFTLRKDGRFVLASDRARNGQGLRVGVRESYRDPHF